jgi:hypothetical protein
MHRRMVLLFVSKISYLTIPFLTTWNLENIIKCGEFLDVLNDDQLTRKVSATQSALRGLNNHSSNP